jgi:hypothetical protein
MHKSYLKNIILPITTNKNKIKIPTLWKENWNSDDQQFHIMLSKLKLFNTKRPRNTQIEIEVMALYTNKNAILF